MIDPVRDLPTRLIHNTYKTITLERPAVYTSNCCSSFCCLRRGKCVNALVDRMPCTHYTHTPGCLFVSAAQQSNRPAVSPSFSSRLAISSSNTFGLLIPCRNNFSAPSVSWACTSCWGNDCEEISTMRAMVPDYASQKMTGRRKKKRVKEQPLLFAFDQSLLRGRKMSELPCLYLQQ